MEKVDFSLGGPSDLPGFFGPVVPVMMALLDPLAFFEPLEVLVPGGFGATRLAPSP